MVVMATGVCIDSQIPVQEPDQNVDIVLPW